MMWRRVTAAVLLAIVAGITLVLIIQQVRYNQAEAAADFRLRAATEHVLPGLRQLNRSGAHWTAKGYMEAARQLISRATAGHPQPQVMLGEYSAKLRILRCTAWSGPNNPDFCSIPIPGGTLPASYVTMPVQGGNGFHGRYRMHFVSVASPYELQKQGCRGVLIAAESFHDTGPFSS